MQLDQNPFFRKAIVPWYDASFACWTLIWAMVIVFGFSLGGIWVVSTTPEFSMHIWFPCMLAGLSGFLALKVYLRLQARAGND
ncbi:MAG: hypothetical protein HUK40_08825 [Desulfobacter sp.]|nr:hypothetical protein [Desulfobacter sp.]WDP84736.1 MAG: hypothetical protein HUN05_05905 [Desulfobacter sp.]